MTKEREALKLALDALEAALSDDKPYIENSKQAITAIKAVWAQPEQEPVAWMYQCSADSSGPVLMQHKRDWAESGSGLWTETPLYTTPPQPEPPPECQTEAEKKAFAFGWFKAMEAQRLAQPEQVIVYRHKDGDTWFRQDAKDPLPEWAVDVRQDAEQEPVAVFDEKFGRPKMLANAPILTHGQKFYTTPPQRKWVGLTDEEIAQGCKESWVTEQAWQSAVWWAEAKLKEKNT